MTKTIVIPQVRGDYYDTWRDPTKKERKKAAKVLRKAAGLIQNVGWCRRTSVKHNDKGKVIGYCSVGALSHAHPAYDPAVARLTEGILETLLDGQNLVSWNDRQRDRRKVIRLFLRGAAVLEQS